jgi:membrane protein DedA with SNARE-associated domain
MPRLRGQLMNKEQQIKNLRLCLKIHVWASIVIVLLWAFLQVYFIVRTETFRLTGWPYLLVLALVYYALRVKLKKVESE